MRPRARPKRRARVEFFAHAAARSTRRARGRPLVPCWVRAEGARPCCMNSSPRRTQPHQPAAGLGQPRRRPAAGSPLWRAHKAVGGFSAAHEIASATASLRSVRGSSHAIRIECPGGFLIEGARGRSPQARGGPSDESAFFIGATRLQHRISTRADPADPDCEGTPCSLTRRARGGSWLSAARPRVDDACPRGCRRRRRRPHHGFRLRRRRLDDDPLSNVPRRRDRRCRHRLQAREIAEARRLHYGIDRAEFRLSDDPTWFPPISGNMTSSSSVPSTSTSYRASARS